MKYWNESNLDTQKCPINHQYLYNAPLLLTLLKNSLEPVIDV